MEVAELDFDGDERFQKLREPLGVSSFGINLIRLKPGQRGRIHRHREQEEVYVVLAGTLTVYLEGEPTEVATGHLARLAPDERRQLVNHGTEPLVLLALGGAGEHSGRDGEAFGSWDETEGRPPQEVPLPEDV